MLNGKRRLDPQIWIFEKERGIRAFAPRDYTGSVTVNTLARRLFYDRQAIKPGKLDDSIVNRIARRVVFRFTNIFRFSK